MKRILVKSGAILCGLVIGVVIGGWVMSAPETIGADEGEEIVPLKIVEPMRREGNLRLDHADRVLIGGRIWNDVMCWHSFYSTSWAYVLYDTGGKYDLFEGWFGIDDAGRSSSTVVFEGDGERLGQIDLRRGDGARFFACPLKRCRALKISFSGESRQALMANARFVSGRTEPSQPQDIYIDDGEIKYIERPGEYRFHVR
jgi:hypothetical protein